MMKSYYILGICCALLWINACQQPDAPKEAMVKAAVTTPPDFLDSTTAKSSISAFKIKWDSIQAILLASGNPSLAKFDVRGFQVKVGDLKGILAAYETARDGDSIYVMMGVRPNATTQKPQTEAIFETWATNRTSTYRVFYDFSHPCPKNCPPNE